MFGPVGKKMKFGFVTDTHHDPIKTSDTSQGGKYYEDSAEKIADIATVFSNSGLSFAFQNGDWIDGSADKAAALVDLQTITDTFSATTVPVHHNIGNHDVWRLTKAEIMGITGQPARWYSFVTGGIKFIVLDGNFTADDDKADLEVSVDDDPAPSPYTSYIPPEQRQWLADTIDASSHPCIIFCHYPVYYVGADSWGLTNGAAVRTILEARSDKVIGCVGGHLHDNYIRRLNGILYASVHATVTGAYPRLNYAIITVYPDAMTFKIEASGSMMSHVEAAAP